MSAEPVQADIGIGTVTGTVVETLPRAEFGTGPIYIHVVEADGQTYRVDEEDIQ